MHAKRLRRVPVCSIIQIVNILEKREVGGMQWAACNLHMRSRVWGAWGEGKGGERGGKGGIG